MWAFPSSAKSRLDEGRPIAFKTRFFDFPHRCETKKHPWDRIPRGRFHTTILGGLFQVAQKALLTKVVQLRSKRVFSTFSTGAKRKNILGIEFHKVGLIPSILGGLFQAAQKAGLTKVVQLRSKRVFSTFPIWVETKKHPWDRIPRGRFHTTILGGLFQAAQKAGLSKCVKLHSKRVLWTFPIGGKRKTSLGIESYEVGFIPTFWVNFSK